MTDRAATIGRKTKETEISLELRVDGTGHSEISTGVGFFDHMLTHLAKHSLMDLKVKATGDLHIDDHHTVEDVSLVLGAALDKALGTKAGIYRYGWASIPMEDTLAHVALDLSGRPAFVFNVDFPSKKIGVFDVELVHESLRSFANAAKMNLHVNVPYGGTRIMWRRRFSRRWRSHCGRRWRWMSARAGRCRRRRGRWWNEVRSRGTDCTLAPPSRTAGFL